MLLCRKDSVIPLPCLATSPPAPESLCSTPSPPPLPCWHRHRGVGHVPGHKSCVRLKNSQCHAGPSKLLAETHTHPHTNSAPAICDVFIPTALQGSVMAGGQTWVAVNHTANLFVSVGWLCISRSVHKLCLQLLSKMLSYLGTRVLPRFHWLCDKDSSVWTTVPSLLLPMACSPSTEQSQPWMRAAFVSSLRCTSALPNSGFAAPSLATSLPAGHFQLPS